MKLRLRIVSLWGMSHCHRHGIDLHIVVGETVRAGLDWRDTSRSQRTLEQQDMLLFVVSDVLQVVVVVGRVACVPR